VDVAEVFDDAIDALIDRVLKLGGNVLFVPSEVLREQQRIVLLPSATDDVQ